MARVDLQEGPSVGVAQAPPNDYQQLQTSPGTFGAGVGEAAERLGGQIGHIGEVWGSIQTDGAINQAMNATNEHLNQYRTLQGAEALDARADTEKAIDQSFTDARAGLKLPAQQLSFDQATRAYKARYVNGIIASHADQQAKAHAAKVNADSFNNAITGVANVSDDDEHVNSFRAMARSALVRQVIAEGNGSDHEAVMDALRRADQAVYKTQVETIGVKDPERALAIAEKHKDILGLSYAQMEGQLRTRAKTQRGFAAVDQGFAQIGQNLGTAAAPDQDAKSAYRQATLEQESGNKGANPGQIQPATWEYWKTKGLVHDGETFDNPDATRAVANRAMDVYYDQYKDPQRAAVAWFSGPDNVAPAGAPTPWVHDVADRTGKTTSSYVGDITSRISQKGPMLAAKASVYDAVLKATDGDPEARQVALTEVDRRYRAAETASLVDDKARKAYSEAALNGYGAKIWGGEKGQPWHADPGLTLQEKEHLDELQQKTVTAELNGKPGDWGPGYSSVLARIYSTAPQGRILWPEQVLALGVGPNAQLNPAGVKQAMTELAQVRKASEGETQLMSNFWAAARHKVTLESDDMKFVIPGQAEQWNKALPVLTQALSAGKAKGLTLEQMLSPESKESIWPVLKPYLPSAAQKEAAEAFKDEKEAGEVANWQGITDRAEAQKLFADKRLTREHAMILAEKNGWYNKPGTAPVVPTGGGPAATAGEYETKLTPEEETKFQEWKAKYAPSDSGADYDLRGAFKADVKPDAERGHFPDTFKKPNHPTFSDQSKYHSKDTPGGKWEERNGRTVFVPSPFNLKQHPADKLKEYFSRQEPGATLELGEGAR